MSDFPRGWTLNSAVGAGATATITVAAIPGVVHVLDTLLGKFDDATGVSTATNVSVTTAAGVVLIVTLVSPTAPGTDQVNLSGLDITSSVGGTIVVAFAAPAPAGHFQTLVIQGHDI